MNSQPSLVNHFEIYHLNSLTPGTQGSQVPIYRSGFTSLPPPIQQGNLASLSNFQNIPSRFESQYHSYYNSHSIPQAQYEMQPQYFSSSPHIYNHEEVQYRSYETVPFPITLPTYYTLNPTHGSQPPQILTSNQYEIQEQNFLPISILSSQQPQTQNLSQIHSANRSPRNIPTYIVHNTPPSSPSNIISNQTFHQISNNLNQSTLPRHLISSSLNNQAAFSPNSRQVIIINQQADNPLRYRQENLQHERSSDFATGTIRKDENISHDNLTFKEKYQELKSQVANLLVQMSSSLDIKQKEFNENQLLIQSLTRPEDNSFKNYLIAKSCDLNKEIESLKKAIEDLKKQ